MRRSRKLYIAEMLVQNGIITPSQLNAAIEEQKKTDKKIGEILVDLGYIEEIQLLQFLSEQLHIPYIDLKNFHLDPEIVKLLPEFYARHFRAIVLKKEAESFLVGMTDPQDLVARDEIEHLLKSKISLALIREDDLLKILDAVYRRAEEISHFAETLSAELLPKDIATLTGTEGLSSEDLPVVNLLRSIFEDASQVNASDIHIEPDEKVLRIRLRVDGVLQEQIVEEKSVASALVQRIKLLSGLNIAEKRLPQDGRFTINVKQKKYDIRVSTIPVQYGESVVLRLLYQAAYLLKLDQIGMPKVVLDAFFQTLHVSYGLLLIVGPTGSGKTTTLYAALTELNSQEDKIITVEDPVEYRLPRINQVQVNPKIDLTFANMLRAILRQDPDIIMIGEIRDKETMDIALRAAMTGHFVLGTLHTNDTISTMTRLLDMGAEGYLIASVLRAILAQRLVRRICPKCINDYPLNSIEINWLKSLGYEDDLQFTFKKGLGCTHCHQTGYTGRVGIFEFLPINPDLADALRNNDTGAFERLAKQQNVYRSLLETGLDLAREGVTTIREVISMAGQV